MAQSEARAWWADVQHLRDAAERTDEARRRADQADLASRQGTRARRSDAAPRRHDQAGAAARRSRPAAGAAEAPFRPAAGAEAPFRPAAGAAEAPFRPAAGAGAPYLREHAHGGAKPARRTVEIRGRTVPAPAVPPAIELDRRRPPRRAVERVGPRPDRMAMWALLMGLLLILVAVGTADAATIPAL